MSSASALEAGMAHQQDAVISVTGNFALLWPPRPVSAQRRRAGSRSA
jgi:hypothetical protein